MLTVVFAWTEDQTLGNAVYFALITGLTVGYGDITAGTPMGKADSAAIAVVGVSTAGIYVGIATRAVAISLRGHRLTRDARPGQYGGEGVGLERLGRVVGLGLVEAVLDRGPMDDLQPAVLDL